MLGQADQRRSSSQGIYFRLLVACCERWHASHALRCYHSLLNFDTRDEPDSARDSARCCPETALQKLPVEGVTVSGDRTCRYFPAADIGACHGCTARAQNVLLCTIMLALVQFRSAVATRRMACARLRCFRPRVPAAFNSDFSTS